MKKCKTIIVFIFSFCISGFSQEYGYLVVNIIDANKTVINEGDKLINIDENLNNTFKDFNVFSYKYAYPKAKNEYLKRFASIECNCNVEELATFLEENYPNYFSDIEYARDLGYPDYDPSDAMWYQTNSDGTPVLWHLNKIESDKAWDITKGASNVTIAIIDRGFDISHPDLTNKILSTVDPRTGNPFGIYFGIVSFHGTFCASCAGAETDGGGELASVGFNTMLMFYDYNISAADIAYHASFDRNADVISFSYTGSTSATTREKLLVREVLGNGTVIVRSAGNTQSDSDDNRFPFAHQVDNRIIIVSSTDKSDFHTNPTGTTHANYPEVSICSPGYSVMGAIRYDNGNVPYPYQVRGGTSYATPIVAGTCALLKSIDKNLTPAQIKNIIQTTADPIADAHLYPGTIGAGRVNAHAAVLAARCYSGLPIVHGTITQSVTWNTDKHAIGTITVPNNVTLTIASTVKFDHESSIIVHPGGKLIVNGGILTAACDNKMWQGIIVSGTSNQQQTAQYQGTVELKNGAVIEHALCAISTVDSTGGIIKVENATFRNNLQAIKYLPYERIGNGGIIADNVGKFTNCTFIIDPANRFSANGKSFQYHV